MSSVLAIGAHPDDIELGCAGLLQRHDVRSMVVLSRGERGYTALAGDRTVEANKAAKVLSAEITLFDLPDTDIRVNDAVGIIEEQILVHQPSVVLTMSSSDIHQDHQAVHRATKIAVRDHLCTILSYTSPSSAQMFRPNWFVPLTEFEMQLKLQALTCHLSQHNKSYFAREYVFGMARYWAMVTRSRSPYVEPYELIRHWEKS